MSQALQLAEYGSRGVGLAFKNRIINGAMMIDQRNAGASFIAGNLGYGIDRWLTQTVGASGSAQRVTGSTGNNNALQITGASSLTTFQVSQRIESVNIYDCASQTVTFSFTLYGSNSGSVSVRFFYPTTTDNYTSVTEPVGGTTVNFTTTPTQYTVTRTLNANANKGVWVLFDFGAVGAGVTRTIEFVQLEVGSTATSFDYRPYGTELILCQRYFEECANSGATNSYILSGFNHSSVQVRGVLRWKTQKRATPTMSANGTNVNWVYTGGTGETVAPLFDNPSIHSCLIFNNASGLTAGQGATLNQAPTGTTQIWASAEL